MNELQGYYRLSPSPPTINIGHSTTVGQQYSSNGISSAYVNGSGMNGYSPSTAYSPTSSSSSGINGQLMITCIFRGDVDVLLGHSPNELYRCDDPCLCVSNPNANHSFISLARTLEGMSNYLVQLPEHTQNRCSILQRIQELRNILQ